MDITIIRTPKKLEIVEHEAEILRYMFDLALKGKGYLHIF